MEIFYKLRNESNEDEIIEYLKSNNLDINLVDEDNYNMLMVAVSRELFNVSKYLISKGININHQNNKGLSILHIIAYNYDEDLLIEILNNNADLSLEDNYGNIALWTSIMNDKGFGVRLFMIDSLVKYGADVNHLNNVNKSPLIISKSLGYSNIINVLEKS
tara:strand:+ start:715 stop:1197 length:483 start_codon:yes stop_codon:yes gene_type:complete